MLSRTSYLLAALACVGMLCGPVAVAFAQQPTDNGLPISSTRGPAIGAVTAISPKLDLKYIPASAVALAVGRPQSMFTGPNSEWMPLEVITAAGLEHTGFDPVKIEEVVVIATAKMGPQPEIGAIVRFSEPYDKAAVTAKLGSMVKPAMAQGKQVLQGQHPGDPSFYLEDPKVLILGMGSLLEQMIADKQEESPLRKLVTPMDFSAELTVVGSIDAVREQVKAILAQAPQLPPPLQPFLKLPDLLSAVLVRLSLTGDTKMTITLKARDEQSATEVEQLVKQALEMGRQAVQSQVAHEVKPSADPVEAAMNKYVRRITNVGFDKLQPVRKGTLVTTTVPTLGSGPATIGVLVALLLPAVQAAREAARRAQSTNNLRQHVLSLLNYESAHGALPAHAIFDKQGKPLLSWRVAILPFLEEEALYQQFHLDEPWDSEHNKALIAHMPPLFAKPGAEAAQVMAGKTTYLAVVGKGLGFEGDKQLKMRDFADGTSNTILLVEANDDQAVTWTKPDDLEVDLNRPRLGLGSSRPEGFLAVFADGHAMVIGPTVSDPTLKALFTRAGGELVNQVELYGGR